MRLRFLLRPGWLALTLVVLMFAIACYTVLAPWQFGRHDERSATNDAVQGSFTSAPAPLDGLLTADAKPGRGSEWRLATVRGSYLADDELVARLRLVHGAAAFEVLTPFRLLDGSVALVDRGFLRPAEDLRAPEYPRPPAGTVDLLTRIRADETDPQHRDAFADPTTNGRRHLYAVDSRTVARATGLDIRPGYLQLEGGSPGVLGALPLPQLDSGPFLSYALQWIAFGTMALLAWAYFSWREISPGGALAEPRPDQRQKRRSVAQQVAEEEAAERERLDVR